MNTTRSAMAAGSSTTSTCPARRQPDLGPHGLVDGGLGNSLRVDLRELVERVRGPSRARAVRRARGEVVVGGGIRVVAEESLRRPDGLDVRRGLDETGRHDVARLAEIERGLNDAGSPFRLAPATSWKNARVGPYVCGSSTGIDSGFSGLSRAISSAARTVRSSAASSNIGGRRRRCACRRSP